ncbi:LAS1 [Candida margitis]|uniref:LAS1 n=1 Tax=Candida margitis TaxID=1775924 RepID=UPI002226A86A|nr:LAS1 [Candida margitis]KAI5968855.1 LAS1 [Candida margitis]
MKDTPVVTAYRSDDDLVELKKWFYDFDDTHDNRKLAIERVKALLTRSRLPHGIEATSILTSAHLRDDDDDPDTDTNVIQLAYTMALIRFVNGLLDPFQQSNYAVPMQLLAKQLNLPTFFVELRHMGTHENMPSLDILRIATKEALTWLYDNYWCHIVDESKQTSNASADIYSEVVHFRSTQYEELITVFSVYENLKTFKRLRKDKLETPLFSGYSNDQDVFKLRNCVNELIEFAKSDPDLFANLLIRKFYLLYPNQKLVSKGIKYNPLLEKLYHPLLDGLGSALIVSLFIKTMQLLDGRVVGEVDRRVFKKLGFATTLLESETAQLFEWLPYLIKSILSQPFSREHFTRAQISDQEGLFKYVYESLVRICKHDDSLLVKLLKIVKESASQNLESALLEEINNAYDEAVKRTSKNAFELPPSLDEILGENANKRHLAEEESKSGKKRSKRLDNNEEKVYLMDPHEDWTPTPFGMPI